LFRFLEMNCITDPDSGKSTVSHDEIARRAYHLWEEGGRPDGRAVQYWLEAEAQLRSQDLQGKDVQTSLGAVEMTRLRQEHAVRYGLVLRT
jgi:hypothetical protein